MSDEIENLKKNQSSKVKKETTEKENETEEAKTKANKKPQEEELKELLSKIIWLINNEIEDENEKSNIQKECKDEKLNAVQKETERLNEKLNSLQMEIERLNENLKKDGTEKNNIQKDCKEKDIKIDELNEKLNSLQMEIERLNENLEKEGTEKNNIQKEICGELNELKNSLAECFSKLNKKQDEKSLLDNLMSQNDRCDRKTMFETIFNEINNLKNSIKVYELSSEIPPSVSRNSIALRLDSLIPIYDKSLLQNLDPVAFKSYHTTEWLCLAFFDLLKKNKLHSDAINEVLEILFKIIKICDERSLDLVEKILNEVENYELVAKYETVRQVMMSDPNRKRRMLNIFIRDLEHLVLSTPADELDQTFQQNNPELYQKIKIILEMSNNSVLDMVDIDTINTLKRRWNFPRTILRQSVLVSQSK